MRNGLGGPDVQEEQLSHLLTVGSLPSVSLGVVPTRTDRLRMPVKGFWILDRAQVNVYRAHGPYRSHDLRAGVLGSGRGRACPVRVSVTDLVFHAVADVLVRMGPGYRHGRVHQVVQLRRIGRLPERQARQDAAPEVQVLIAHELA
ncbi:hypothetical protein SXANM310S_07148 [Streptomyces xanthochromogenes]